MLYEVITEKAEIRKMDLYTLFALAATEECMKDSGIDLDACDRNKIGVILATGIGGMQTFEEEMLKFGENPQNPRFSPFFITKMISNIATGQISIRYGLHGISYSVTSACASSNNAIANARITSYNVCYTKLLRFRKISCRKSLAVSSQFPSIR